MICNKCGKEIPEGSSFCTECGAPVEAIAEKAVEQVLPAVSENQVAPVEEEKPACPADVSPKSRLAALLLGIFLGELGVHNFYLKRIGRAVGQLILFIIGIILYVAGFALMMTGIIDTSDVFDPTALGGSVLVILSVFVLMAPSIWSLVEWILIACGRANDGNGKAVKNWTN